MTYIWEWGTCVCLDVIKKGLGVVGGDDDV